MVEETKGKYGALIQKAREAENQKSVKPDSQINSESDDASKTPESRGVKKSESQKNEKLVNQKTGLPENQKTKIPNNKTTGHLETEEIKEREVNLCVKVPESLRRHWAAESKREGITMTEVIIQALEDRFGRPE